MLPGKKRALTARSGVVCGFVLMGFAAVTGASFQNLTSPSMSGVFFVASLSGIPN